MMQNMDVQMTTKIKPQRQGILSVPSPYFGNWEYGFFTQPVRPKRRLAIWMHNNCGARSKRHELVKQLMKYMQVDSYGKCLHNKDDKRARSDPLALVGEYKFYIMLENVFGDDDWVSSTFFRTIAVGTVPVYKGAPNIAKFLPHKDAAILWDDYQDVEALANRLKYLDEHDDEYMKHLAWKKNGASNAFQSLMSINDVDPWCRLCGEVAGNKGFANEETMKMNEWTRRWHELHDDQTTSDGGPEFRNQPKRVETRSRPKI